MIKPLLRKLRPANGISYFLHFGLVLVLPIVVLLLVRLDSGSFTQLALSVVVLSKWRMFAVKPRFWAANIRANAVDLMVGLSLVVLMTLTTSAAVQLLWAAVYAVWLLVIKPRSDAISVSIQAAIAQLLALSALFAAGDGSPTVVLTLLAGLFCYYAARHFFDTYNEPYARMLSYAWGYFGAALAWLLSHWMLFYGVVSQATLLLSVLGYGLAGLYYLDHNDKLNKGLQRQFVLTMVAVVAVVLVLSRWRFKAV